MPYMDMSAAFDTIDHTIMLDVLNQRFDVHEAALDWFASYFRDRTQVVVVGANSSLVSELRKVALQESFLGPKSFVAYAEDVTAVFQQHHVSHHLFANDMQGIRHSKPSNVRDVTIELGACLADVNNWFGSKRLQLNMKKTELFWFGSATNLSKLSSVDKVIPFKLDQTPYHHLPSCMISESSSMQNST